MVGGSGERRRSTEAEATPPEVEPTDSDETVERSENGTDTGDGDTDGRAPGFGAVGALAAVVAVALASLPRVGGGRD